MKFPSANRLVPHLTLSDVEREHYAKMGHALVNDMIAQYVEYDQMYHRQVNHEQWKAVKKREGLTVYKERKIARPKVMRELQAMPPPLSTTARSTLDSDPQPLLASATKWVVPTLLMVGSIVGTLDDVMFGAATFDAPSMLLKTTYTHDELLDGEVLSQIDGPTREDPFRFLGLKWIVKGNPPGMSKLVRPRDLVFLEATGVRTSTTNNNERIGYHLMHSLDLPGFAPLPRDTGVLRGRVSSCFVFKQCADNASVDVFMKANFDPNGNVGEAVAVLSAANGLIYCARSVVCAQHKKLAHLLAIRARTAAPQQQLPTSATRSSSACCTCGKAARSYRSLVSCALCRNALCSTCRVAKKISFTAAASTDSSSKQIHRRLLPFCSRCVTHASQASAFTIARDQVHTAAASGERDASSSSRGLFARWQTDDVALSVPALSDSILSISHVSLDDTDWQTQSQQSERRQQTTASRNSAPISITQQQQRPVYRAASSLTLSPSGRSYTVSGVSSARSSSAYDVDTDVDDDADDVDEECDPTLLSSASSSRRWTQHTAAARVLYEQHEGGDTAAVATSRSSTHSVSPVPQTAVDAQALLYQRIAQLRDVAENVYKITMTNATAMSRTSMDTASVEETEVDAPRREQDDVDAIE